MDKRTLSLSRVSSIYAVGLFVAAASGCAPLPRHAPTPTAVQPPSVDSADVDAQAADVRTAPMARATPQTALPQNNTVVALVERAQRQRREGLLVEAAATLERALRIAPQDPALWHHLAGIRYEQTQFGQAEQLAAKSNTFAGDDKQLLAQNWRLIGRVREHTGDSQGASLAYAKARSLESDR